MKYTLGADVGGTKIAYGLFDSKHNLIEKYKYKSDRYLDPEAFCNRMMEQIGEILQKHSISTADLDGLGIAMPSFILFEEGVIVKTSNLPLIHDFAMRSWFEQALGVRVVLDNDANAAALAEHRYGAARGFSHSVYCAVSTGISNGIIINDRLFRGSYGWAGESGHMIADIGARDSSCSCGNAGCFESHISGGRIVTLIADWIRSGEKSIMSDLCANMLDNLTAEHLLSAYLMDDSLAIRAVEHMAQHLGVWLYNIYLVLNINCYVFGGGLVNFGGALFDRAKNTFDALNADTRPVHFQFAELGSDFGIIGASLLLD